jgi:hypothetical protein
MNIEAFILTLADRQRIAIEMLIAGVAFKQDGTRWDVYSHGGDEVGTLSTYMLCEAACTLRKLGLKSSSDFGGYQKKEYGVMTFYYGNHLRDEWVEELIEKRTKNVKHLM